MAPNRPRTRLGQVLDEEGRRQTWLADQLGVKPRAVWTWVHGIHEPEGDDRKAEVARVLGRTVEELFPATDEGDDEPVAA